MELKAKEGGRKKEKGFRDRRGGVGAE